MSGDSYTRYPRPILWLVEGGKIEVGGAEEDAQPPFEVEVEPFYVSKLPITNEQLEACQPGFQRSRVSAGDRDPATGVSFAAAVAYCEWYARVSRKPMRLPTEVEWEYACRAGSRDRLFCGDPAAIDAYVWHRDNSGSGDQLPDLEAKKANGFGLYGMLGGLWEWTSTPYQPYPLGEGAAGAGSETDCRVLRGGSFRLASDKISCSLRRPEKPTARCDDVGFRIVKSFARHGSSPTARTRPFGPSKD